MSFSATYSGPDGKGKHVSGSLSGEAGRRCGLRFNPSGDEQTAKAKGFCASAMAAIIEVRDNTVKPDETASHDARTGYADKMRLCATALTYLESAQMFGVKAIHAETNAKS